jgi:hypothetical protein
VLSIRLDSSNQNGRHLDVEHMLDVKMSEALFRAEVEKWCWSVISEYIKSTVSAETQGLGRLCVENLRLITGWQPWSSEANPSAWFWKEFKREIDVVVGLRVEIDEGPNVLPLVAIELKSGSTLNSDELDKKSAIYGPLRELYPWVHTVFLHEDLSQRNLGEDYLFRNGRQFDSIFTEWNGRSKALLKRLLLWKLDYLIGYWGL